ncbi:hypothetical protein WMY93_004750 [Mugilogobius chulae]|uniref:Coiled-coil domain-containing protein 157 n=1 Tax=Mugilogobius chulae TaxID=88201 RepID=A0AAW0PS12_9GOBI
MTDFLGRQDCIESLRKDLVDLQGAILDVFSRTGPVRFSSWKFPDKLSCNLDMVALLSQYDFIDGEGTFNQHSHVVLLELVIDRLLLLLQSFNVFVEQQPNLFKSNQSQEKGFVSLGLVVRNYWSNLVTYKASYREQTLCDDALSSLESCPRTSHFSSSTNSLLSWSLNHGAHSSNQSTTCTPKVDTQNVGSQTFESCLVPCDACYQTQSVLRKTGGALIELFQSEGLPSSLQPLSVAVQDTVELGRMTATDVAQWGAEEYRDMRRLSKHLQDVRGTVEPLKAKIVTLERENNTFKSDMKKLQKELKGKVENYQASNVQLEFSLQKAQRSAKETQQRRQEEQQKSQREIMSLNERNSNLMEKITMQQDAIKTLETENNSLQETIRHLQEEKENCSHKLHNEIQKSQGEILDLQLCLHKEKARYNSACRQQESMQVKQKTLVERVKALDEECEELQRQLAESEEKQIQLHDQIQQMSDDREKLQAQFNQQQDSCVKLEKDKETLDTKISDLVNTVTELKEHLKACSERERLLVAFPDLNPLPHAHPQSTGNVTLDMEQQLNANCIRIRVLEQENSTLHSSLLKLKERAQINDAKWQCPAAPAYSNDRKEAGGESSPKSAASEDRMTTSASSLSSVQLHFQNLQLRASSAKTKKDSPKVLLHSRTFKQRRK